MTIGAVRLGMHTCQRKTGPRLVLKSGIAPLCRGVTRPAVICESAAVHIFIRVTADAGLRQCAREVSRMARLARQVVVPAFERKAGNHPVVEIRSGPGRVVVTTGAFRTVSSFVYIVLAMTRVTTQRSADKSLVTMTVDALCAFMRGTQRKHCHRMIECNCFPVGRNVTTRANRAEHSHMHVVVDMTITALLICLAKRRPFGVAVSASDLLVRAIERKICKEVIERRRFELNYLRIAAFMLLVTREAPGIESVRMQSMKSPSRTPVLLHIHVTTTAKTVLALSLVSYVTAIATFLNAGMRRDYRTGHHEPLDIEKLRLGTSRRQCAHDEHRDNQESSNATIRSMRH